MDIGKIELGNTPNNTISRTQDVSRDSFKELLSKITGGEIAEEIRDKYNITLDVGSMVGYQQILDTYDLKCTNYVRISPETLSKMESDPALKAKVLEAIEEFCSSESQASIKSLAPPVKSAGMIVYPDGKTFYWLEGYPNDFENEKDKKIIVGQQSLDEAFEKYVIEENSLSGKGLQTVMQIMATSYKWKNTQ